MVQYGSIRIRIIPQVARTATPRPAAGAAAAAGRRPRRPRRGPRPKQAPASQSVHGIAWQQEGRGPAVSASTGCLRVLARLLRHLVRQQTTTHRDGTTHHASRTTTTGHFGNGEEPAAAQTETGAEAQLWQPLRSLQPEAHSHEGGCCGETSASSTADGHRVGNALYSLRMGPHQSEAARCSYAGCVRAGLTDEEQLLAELRICDDALKQCEDARAIGDWLIDGLMRGRNACCRDPPQQHLPWDSELQRATNLAEHFESTFQWGLAPATLHAQRKIKGDLHRRVVSTRSNENIGGRHTSRLQHCRGHAWKKKKKKNISCHHRLAKKFAQAQADREARRVQDTEADEARQQAWSEKLSRGPLLMPAGRGGAAGAGAPAARSRRTAAAGRRVDANLGVVVNPVALGVDAATARLLQELQWRDVLPEDYELLGRLDEPVDAAKQKGLPPAVVQALPELVVSQCCGWAHDRHSFRSGDQTMEHASVEITRECKRHPQPQQQEQSGKDEEGAAEGTAEQWRLRLYLPVMAGRQSSQCGGGSSSIRLIEPVCAVCQMPWEARECVRRLPCDHLFHRECIDEWLLRSSTCCPIDKREVQQS
jgi:hypothetical protein